MDLRLTGFGDIVLITGVFAILYLIIGICQFDFLKKNFTGKKMVD